MAVEGSFGDWTPITVHLTGEISARDRSHPYKGSMFAAYPGDIVFSKIDARSGAIGVLSPEIERAVVTPEFPVFTPDPARLDGRFVKLILRTGDFLAGLRRKATGTSGRKRITPEAFLDIQVPLPSRLEQHAIITTYDATLGHVADLERTAMETEAKAMTAFETALGFGPPSPLPDRRIFAASFKDLDRWSHEGILRRLVEGDATHTPTYPIVQLRDVIANLENGWSPKCHDRPAEADEWGVLKVSAASAGRYREQENKALQTVHKPRQSLEVRSGDVLITRASGVARLVGVAAHVEATRKHLMLCDKLFRAVFNEPSLIDPRFLVSVLGIHFVRGQIEREFSTKSGMMKNVSKPVLMSLSIPLPPVKEQVAMIKALMDARAKASLLRQRASTERAAAWTKFEAAVYGSSDMALAGSSVGALS